MSKKSKKYYLHTIDGCPAFFDGEMIVFASGRGFVCPLVDSLVTIRKQQKLSKEYRAALGFYDTDYGHVIVKEPS